MKNAFSITYLILSCAVSTVGQPTVGALQGVVTDVQGVPLPAAQVRYQRIFRTVTGTNGQPVPAPGEAVVQSKISVNPVAAFLVPGLPPGDYLLCASVPSAAYLDPCQWATPLRVTVSPNALTTQSIALAKGVFLNVRVNDPLGLLPQNQDGPMLGGKLAVGVNYANGAYAGAPNTGVDGTGRDYQRIVPVGIPLNLWLFSSDVALADASGKPVNSSGAMIPFQATAGQDQVFTFAVSGAVARSL
jgi:hypothetical protein